MGSNKEIEWAAAIATLQQRVNELEDTLHAIRTGQVDALVDGTDIYTLESAESASNRFRGQVLQQISETVIAVDNEQRITYINEATEVQYDRRATDVIGLPIAELFEYRWNDPADEQAARDGLREHGHWRGENIHVRRDGQVLHVESVINVLRDETGERIGLLAVMRDISQQVKHRAEQTESARQKDHFLATLAHELRNPLAPLMNGLQLLEGDDVDRDLIATTRAMMQRQLDQLVRLVDDLLDMSRISRGKLELRSERLDLEKVLNMAVETSKPLIDRNGHHLNVLVEPGFYPVHGDSTRLTQIISNLLNNAAKYTPSGGAITVELLAHDGHALVRVLDNGIGIGPEEVERIFDMFTQVDASVQGAGGLGIGLNIAQRLAVMHGGQLEVHSDGRNKGACFTLRIPLVEITFGHTTDVAHTRIGVHSGVRILVVDDNKDIAYTMVMLLRKAGHQAEAANDGQVALRIGARMQPHLVLMDIGMPVMDGYETCRRMRAQRWGQRARIVAISGWGQEEDRKKSRDAGFDGHVVKPMERATLERLIVEVNQRSGD
jgi:PAS domain S-box-containing protein